MPTEMNPDKAIAATKAMMNKMMAEKQLFLKIILYTPYSSSCW